MSRVLVDEEQLILFRTGKDVDPPELPDDLDLG